MKTAPAPDVPGNTPWERLDSAVRMAFSVPKEAVAKKEPALKKKRARRARRAKK